MFAGFSTGKADVLDLGEPLDVPVNPGGFAVYRNGRVVGGSVCPEWIPIKPSMWHLSARPRHRA